MKHLVLVRHGESELNAVNRQRRVFCGQFDTPLTSRGREQAVEAAKHISKREHLQITRAVSSPLQRAHETLLLMLDHLPRPIELLGASRDLLERSLGVFEGRCDEDVYEEFPHFRDDRQFNRFQNHFEQKAVGGENLMEVTKRAWPAIEELMGRGVGDLLVVSHYNTIRCIVGRALRLSETEILGLRIPNAVPIVLRGDGEFALIEGLE